MVKMEELESGNQSVKVEESEVTNIKLEELHHSIDIKEENSIDESQMDGQLQCGYYFVLFNKDNSVAVVPCSWVTKIEENKTYNCFWPGVTITPNMVRKCVPPKMNWECYSVTIQGRFDSYESADQAIDDFNGVDSMMGYVNNYGRGKREPKKRKFSDDEDDEKEVIKLKPAKNKYTRLKTVDNDQFDQNADHLGGTSNNVDADLLNTEKLNGMQTLAGDEEGQSQAKFSISCYKKLLQELTLLKSLVQRTLSKVTLLEQKLEHYEGKTKTYRFAHMTPVKSVENLQSIENGTRNFEDAKEELKIWFLSIGGVNPKDFIVRCLQRFFSNKLGTSCSWTGQKNNYKLKNLIIMATMLEACRELFPNWTDREYEVCVREWFRHCMQRYKRECPLQEDSQ